jgi:hypothetical protein
MATGVATRPTTGSVATRPSTSTGTATRPTTGTTVTRPSTSTTTAEESSGNKIKVDPGTLAAIIEAMNSGEGIAMLSSGDFSTVVRPGKIKPVELLDKSGDRFVGAGTLVRPSAKSGDKATSGENTVATRPTTSSGENKKTETSGENTIATRPTQTETKVEKIVWAKASSWALDELSKANDAGLIPTIFDKQDLTKNITRKEFAHVAVRLYEKLSGKKATAASKNPFKDTKDEEVLKAYEVGITKGVSETEFGPDKEITREQMATMMQRALQEAGIDTKVDLTKVKEFTDDKDMHNWSREAIYFMSEAGIIKGVSVTENRYGVTGTATREQALLISVRSVNAFAKK